MFFINVTTITQATSTPTFQVKIKQIVHMHYNAIKKHSEYKVLRWKIKLA